MNYSYIENLVKLSKTGDEYSKEMLIEEFRPFIINISKKLSYTDMNLKIL